MSRFVLLEDQDKDHEADEEQGQNNGTQQRNAAHKPDAGGEGRTDGLLRGVVKQAPKDSSDDSGEGENAKTTAEALGGRGGGIGLHGVSSVWAVRMIMYPRPLSVAEAPTAFAWAHE